jgi:cytochrome d ubiquinol oxidase subunit II
MSLGDVWFVLFVVIIAGYVILDGFDLGVGILHPYVARSDEERRVNLNAIGPIWDGNEVWLVLGGGVLFAAFPIVYATLFSGFYTAMMLVLLFLILRAVAIEFRSKLEGARWRGGWDWVFSLSSVALALLLGIAFGNIVVGVPINAEGNIETSGVIELLGPFPLLVGATTVVMFAVHGAHYLVIKTDGDVQARARRWLPRLMGLFAILGLVAAAWLIVANYPVMGVYREQIVPIVVPIAAVAALVLSAVFVRQGRETAPFFAWATVIGLLLLSVGVGLYPNLLVSTISPDYNLTVANSSSADNTLAVMLIVAIIGIPFILLYTFTIYYLFRGKVRLSPHSY